MYVLAARYHGEQLAGRGLAVALEFEYLGSGSYRSLEGRFRIERHQRKVGERAGRPVLRTYAMLYDSHTVNPVEQPGVRAAKDYAASLVVSEYRAAQASAWLRSRQALSTTRKDGSE